MTVASCSIVPTFSVRFRATTLRPSTITFSCTIGAKPWAVAVTRYSPAGSGDSTYTPEPLVRRVVSTPVAAFFATTEALGTTAPDGSKIVPVIDPAPPICASATTGAASRTAPATRRNAEFALMPNLPLTTRRRPRTGANENLMFGQDATAVPPRQARKPLPSLFRYAELANPGAALR